MILLMNSFFAALFDVTGPFNVVSYPIFYVPVGISMSLFALALGVLLFLKESVSKIVRFIIAGVLTLIGVLLLLWGVFLIFITIF